MNKGLLTIRLIKRGRKLREREILKHFSYISYKAVIIPNGKYGLQLIVLMDSLNKSGLETHNLDRLGTTAMIGQGGASVVYLNAGTFFNDWEIINRRVLVEKSKCL
jgi:hypothetical protein